MKYIFYLSILLLFISCTKNPSKKQYLLNIVDKEHTGITFKNEIKDDAKYNVINYLYYYNGGGVAVGDINNDDLPDIYFVSNKGDNKLYLNKGKLKFEDITNKAMVAGSSDWNTGVTMVDVNNDGYQDIYVCAVTGILDFKGSNELFINNGDGTFSERAKEFGLDYKGYSTQSYFFDYDKDNDLDIYIVNHAVHTKSSHGPAQIRKKRAGYTGDVLLKNDNGKFIDASEEAKIFGGANGYGLSASIADFNNDGWDDIYVCNDFHEDDYYYLNNKDGTFTESLKNHFSTLSRFSMGSDAGDINSDGYQDIITLDMLPKDERVLKESEGDVSYDVQNQLIELGYQNQYSRNMLQLNSRGNYFTESGLFNGIADTDWSWAPLIADFNQDGHQDLFITNGIYKRPNNLDFMKYISNSFKNKTSHDNQNDWLINSLKVMPEGKVPNQIFEGNSNKFSNMNSVWLDDISSLSNGAAYGDLDNDGDLDLVINNLNSYAQIFENTLNSSNNYLKIKLNYKEQNVNGLGSKLIIFTNKKKQLKQLFPSRGFMSSVNLKLHFGLGVETSVDSIIVIWPDNSYQSILTSKLNTEIVIDYDDSSRQIYSYNKKNTKAIFEEIQTIDYKHEEDNYNDFNYEKLIPYKVSTAGPAMAVGDIDNNGYEDIFLGNASGKEALIYLNNGLSFSKKPNIGIENDSLYEDVDACFFDADNDKDLDLYVSTGINKYRNSDHEVDRLYINDGSGNFTRSKNYTPLDNFNSSCVKAYDYDNDSDIDLFIGNRSNPNDFGQNVESFILQNNGKGNFTKDVSFSLNSKVTDAVWNDINGDGIKDLLISTEWDTPKIYINNNGNLVEQIIKEEMNGLWQTISTFDVDNDDDKDIMLGNWGLNSKFKPSNDAPLLMYYSDFDTNGKNETVLAYKIDEKYYPVNSKDELASQMNAISKRFTKYQDFAFKPIENVLTKKALENAKRYKVNTLASGYLKNDNGKFESFVEFPPLFQLSPIMSFTTDDFDKNQLKDLLVTGNFHGLNTYHGSLNSFNSFLMTKDSVVLEYTPVDELGLKLFKKQVRNVKILKMKSSKLLLIAPNNNRMITYTYGEN